MSGRSPWMSFWVVIVPRRSPSRSQVAMYLMRKETDASLPQIGEVLGGRDHTTVMYAIEKIANQIETTADLRKRVISVKQQLYGQTAVV